MNKIDEEKSKNLAAGGKFRLEDIPLRKFFDQAQYIEKTLLPAIEKKSGKNADYQFFCEVYKSLLYAVMITERNEKLILKIQQANQFNQLLHERASIAERELLKFETVEDIIMTDGLNRVMAIIAKRVENLLTNK